MVTYLDSAVFEHQFWLQVLGDHSRFIHDSLYPSETEDIAKAASFIHQFDQLLAQVGSLNESNAILFANNAEEMELSAEVLGIFSASMADHMAREEQYYLMKLAESTSM